MHFDTLILYKIKDLSSVKLETRACTGLVVVSIDGSLTCPDVFPVIRKLAWVQDVGDFYIFKKVCVNEGSLATSISSLLREYSRNSENEDWFPVYQKLSKAGFAYYEDREVYFYNTPGIKETRVDKIYSFQSLEEAFSIHKEDIWKNLVPCAVEGISVLLSREPGGINFQEYGNIDSYLDALSSFSPPTVDCLLIQASNNTDWFLYCYEDR